MPNHPDTGLLFLFSSKMETLLKAPCYTIRPNQSIAEAARLMSEKKADALVITNNGLPEGIVTESDLVQKAMAQELDFDTPISEIMSANIVTIQKDQAIFDGLMLMVKHGIRHLLVLEKEVLAGIVSGNDWAIFQRRHPVVTIHEIDKANSFKEIGRLKHQTSNLARKIFEKEGNAIALITLFSEINDRVTRRVIELVLNDMKHKGKGNPPVPFSWIGMESEGRKAQTISTDQDNGIIYENVPLEQEVQAKAWFMSFAERVVAGLETCGFPRCLGNIMATNPELCNSLKGWQNLFNDITDVVDPPMLLKASIYFDFRHIYGSEKLTRNLKEYLIDRINLNQGFLRHMAGNMMISSRPPINTFKWRLRSLFKLTPPSFDIKRQALAPLVDATRILALKCGSYKTNTLERLNDVKGKIPMSREVVDAAKDAYDFIMLLRVRHDFEFNSILKEKFNPKTMNPLQQSFLKEALISIYTLQSSTFFLIGGIES